MSFTNFPEKFSNWYQNLTLTCCSSPTAAVKKAHIDCLKSYTDQIKEFSTQDQQTLAFTCFRYTVWNDGHFDNDKSVMCVKYLVEELGIVLRGSNYLFLFGQTSIDQQHKAELAEYIFDRFDYTDVDKVAQGMEILVYHMYDSDSTTARTLKLLPLLHKHGMLHLAAIQRCLRYFSAAELRFIVETLGVDVRSCTYDKAEDIPPWSTRPSVSSIDDTEWLVAYFNMTDYATFPFQISLYMEATNNLDLFIEYPCIRKLVMSVEHRTHDCNCSINNMITYRDPDERCPFLACYEAYNEHRHAAVKVIEEATGLPADVVRHEIVQYL